MPELQTLDATLVEALTEALETMAFVSLMPPEQEQPDPGPQAVLVSIAYSGPESGTLELVAPESLGLTIAANIIGTAPDDPDAAARGADALKELLNVTCGVLLARRDEAQGEGGQGAGGRFHMGVPHLRPFETQAQWAAFAARPGVHILDAEGAIIAIAPAAPESSTQAGRTASGQGLALHGGSTGAD